MGTCFKPRAERSGLLSMNACSRVAQWIRHGLSLDSVRERVRERRIEGPRCYRYKSQRTACDQ